MAEAAGAEERIVQTLRTEWDPGTRSYLPDLQIGTPGTYMVSAVAIAGGQVVGRDRQLLVVEATDLEMTEVKANRDLMTRIARLSGGEVIPADANGASALVAALKTRAPSTTEYRRTPLWNNWTALTLLLGLLSAEWILRRVRGLA